MSNRRISKFFWGTLCFAFFLVVLMFSLQDDSPVYEWVPFEDTAEETNNVILISDSKSVSSGYNEIQLTATNNSPYTIVVSFRYIEIQKCEDGSWYTFRSTQEYTPSTSNSKGYIGTFVNPGESATYTLLLTDLLPVSLRTSGNYRIYCPISFLLNENDDSETVSAYISAPISITNE